MTDSQKCPLHTKDMNNLREEIRARTLVNNHAKENSDQVHDPGSIQTTNCKCESIPTSKKKGLL